MSFFGGGGAPIKTLTYLVTTADLINSIIIAAFTTLYPIFQTKAAGGYNGFIGVQYQAIDNSWNTINNINTGGACEFSDLNRLGGIFGNVNPAPKFPFVLRIIIDGAATVGTCDLTIKYI